MQHHTYYVFSALTLLCLPGYFLLCAVLKEYYTSHVFIQFYFVYTVSVLCYTERLQNSVTTVFCESLQMLQP